METTRNQIGVYPEWGNSLVRAGASFRVIDGPGTSATFEATTTHEFTADNDSGDNVNGVTIKYKISVYRQQGNGQVLKETVEEFTRNFNLGDGDEYTHVDLANRDNNPLDNTITRSFDMVDGFAYWCEAYTRIEKGAWQLQATELSSRVHS